MNSSVTWHASNGPCVKARRLILVSESDTRKYNIERIVFIYVNGTKKH